MPLEEILRSLPRNEAWIVAALKASGFTTLVPAGQSESQPKLQPERSPEAALYHQERSCTVSSRTVSVGTFEHTRNDM